MSGTSATTVRIGARATAMAVWLMAGPAGAGQATDPWLHLSITSTAPSIPASPPNPMQLASVRLEPPAADVPADDARMRFLTTQSVACLVTGGTATLAALGFGWQNVTNLISGGVVPAAGPGAVALGLFGVVFTSFCAIGQALTPLYLDIVNGDLRSAPVERYAPPHAPQAEQTSRPSPIHARALPAVAGPPWADRGCSSNVIVQVPVAGIC